MGDSDGMVEGMVVDPDGGDLILLDKLTEKELLVLLVKIAEKAKRIRSKHSIRHGTLLDLAKVLRRTYDMNLHRWGIDKGISQEKLDFFEHKFKNAL